MYVTKLKRNYMLREPQDLGDRAAGCRPLIDTLLYISGEGYSLPFFTGGTCQYLGSEILQTSYLGSVNYSSNVNCKMATLSQVL